MGYQPDMQTKAESCGVSTVGSLADFSEAIQKAQHQKRPIHFLPQYQAQNRIKLSEMLNIPVEAVNEYISEPFTRAVIAMRSVKSAAEIESLIREGWRPPGESRSATKPAAERRFSPPTGFAARRP